MPKSTWVILGATSIIAEEFARLAAQHGHPLLLVGRDASQLAIISSDLILRYSIECTVFGCDFSNNDNINQLLDRLNNEQNELDILIAHSDILENQQITQASIEQLVQVNILSCIKIITTYWQKPQQKHRLVFLSSVAACRGRHKNSLYGASKAAIEIFLQGLQQSSTSDQAITIARLGFIDTQQTFGIAPFAASPSDCALACWKASYRNKRQIYYPFFWRAIMLVIGHMPFVLYKRMKAF